MFPFTVALERIKYLGKHLAKKEKGFYSENYGLFMKEILKDTNKCKDILCSRIIRLNIV